MDTMMKNSTRRQNARQAAALAAGETHILDDRASMRVTICGLFANAAIYGGADGELTIGGVRDLALAERGGAACAICARFAERHLLMGVHRQRIAA